MCTPVISTALAARSAGEPWPVAPRLALLMQTKGLMEVVILTIFWSAWRISAEVFSVLILMALVCTASTMPVTATVLGRQARLEGVQNRLYGKT